MSSIGILLSALGSLGAQCTNAWLPAVAANGAIETIAAWDPDGDGPQPTLLAVGGSFSSIGGIPAANVAVWNPATGVWATLGSGMTGTVNELRATASGDLLAAGFFTTAGGVACSGVARWRAGAWQPVGTGPGGFPVHVIETDQGHVVATGFFSGGIHNVASCVAGVWSYATTDVNPGVPALAKLVDGTVLLSGSSGIYAWTPTGLLGFAGLPAPTTAICALRGGGFVAAGSWAQIGGQAVGYIARWNGTAWQPLGAGLDFSFPFPLVSSIVELPDGDLVIGGSFPAASGVVCNNIARWNGGSWSALGAGTVGGIAELAFLPHGLLAVGGTFTSAGGLPASRFAVIGTSCPGSAQVAGASCAGSGGNSQLSAHGVPLLGGTFTAVGSGLPASSVAIVVHGLQPIVPGLPLAALLPPAAAGCDLHVFPVVFDFAVPANGTARASLAVPDDVSWLGTTLFQQWVVLEVGGGLVLDTTATNALQVTVGAF
ncbi:MAG: hypothetical protein JNL08_12825 [Planctomycetes bacterium]|nr:hypothetical protein [Planctomycetota bacterium]